MEMETDVNGSQLDLNSTSNSMELEMVEGGGIPSCM
jgi:hypothetical protein